MTLERYENEMEQYFPLIGRLLIGSFFVFQGVTKVTGGLSGFASYLESLGLPATTAFAVLVVAIEAGGGLAVLLGFKSRAVELLLALYLVLVNLIAHQFWADMSQLSTFMKNIAIIGGLLTASLIGSGEYSVDSYLE